MFRILWSRIQEWFWRPSASLSALREKWSTEGKSVGVVVTRKMTGVTHLSAPVSHGKAELIDETVQSLKRSEALIDSG
jgi:hypothetical protein